MKNVKDKIISIGCSILMLTELTVLSNKFVKSYGEGEVLLGSSVDSIKDCRENSEEVNELTINGFNVNCDQMAALPYMVIGDEEEGDLMKMFDDRIEALKTLRIYVKEDREIEEDQKIEIEQEFAIHRNLNVEIKEADQVENDIKVFENIEDKCLEVVNVDQAELESKMNQVSKLKIKEAVLKYEQQEIQKLKIQNADKIRRSVNAQIGIPIVEAEIDLELKNIQKCIAELEKDIETKLPKAKEQVGHEGFQFIIMNRKK